MFVLGVRSAQSHAAPRARHLDLKVTRDDMSRNIPPSHLLRAPGPCTCHHPDVAREIVFVAKVTRDTFSVTLDPRRALRPVVHPQTLKHGRVWRIPPFAARLERRCCITYELSCRDKSRRWQRGDVRETCTGIGQIGAENCTEFEVAIG